ncbi:MAG: PIN domain-containing protein [Bryobacteraceae bacterium]
MNVSPFFDTNVLIYAFREEDPRNQTARMLLGEGGVIGVQVLNEFVAIAKRKLGFGWEEVLQALAAIRVLCPSVVPLTLETHERALQIAQRYGYHVFDALVIAAAIEAGSSMLYTEDMQDGQRIETVTLRNPFSSQARHKPRR